VEKATAERVRVREELLGGFAHVHAVLDPRGKAGPTGFGLYRHLTDAERVRARRGHQIAIVASARKLACLFWCLLTRKEDYAYAQPSLTRKKLRRLEITAGAQRHKGGAGIWAANTAMRQAERELARQAEAAYVRTVRDWQATAAKRAGASATPGRASEEPSKGQAARQTTSP
jgi:hypothetical protein